VFVAYSALTLRLRSGQVPWANLWRASGALEEEEEKEKEKEKSLEQRDDVVDRWPWVGYGDFWQGYP